MRRVFSLLEIFLQDFLLLSSPFNDYDMALLEFSVSQSLNKHFTRKVKHEEMVVCCRKTSLDRNHPSNWINYREISDCLSWILKQESAQFATFLLIQSSFPCLIHPLISIHAHKVAKMTTEHENERCDTFT